MSAIRKLDPVEATIMEPLYDGGYQLATIRKNSYQCLGCGLVWAMKWHAETCESRRHVDTWYQPYAYGPVVNGVPARTAEYPRTALARAAIPEPAPSKPRVVRCGVYCTGDGSTLVFTSPTGRSARVSAPLDPKLVRRCNDAIWDCKPVTLTLDEMSLIQSLADSISDPNPADLALQQAIGLMPPSA